MSNFWEDHSKGQINLKDISIKHISIKRSHITSLNLSGARIERFALSSDNVIDDLSITESEISNGYFGESSETIERKTWIRKLKISSISKNAELSFWNSEIENLLVTGKYSPESFILFQNLSYDSLEITNSTNFGSIIFNNITKKDMRKAKVVFYNSILGNTTFNNFSFSDTLEIINCDLSQIRVYNVEWPKTIHSTKDGDKTEDDFNKTRETYRNLKKVLYGQGDKVNGNYFYSQEMKAYKKSLNRKNDTNFDRIILWFNSLSNFGQDYILSSLYTILFGEIIFILVVISAGLPEVNYFAKFWEFMLPTHRFDFIPQTGLSTFFDFVGRIIISVLIFITIRSFRKLN